MFKKMGKQIILPQINYSQFTENFEVNSTKQGGGKQGTEMPGRENAFKSRWSSQPLSCCRPWPLRFRISVTVVCPHSLGSKDSWCHIVTAWGAFHHSSWQIVPGSKELHHRCLQTKQWLPGMTSLDLYIFPYLAKGFSSCNQMGDLETGDFPVYPEKPTIITRFLLRRTHRGPE